MGNSRDDFTSATKELLANRVGRRCSNPACRKLTCGANTNPEKITNIGVAAHICAAAQGGPRYDASMTPEERKSFENGIWLCQSCSKLIDTDITRYPKESFCFSPDALPAHSSHSVHPQNLNNAHSNRHAQFL